MKNRVSIEINKVEPLLINTLLDNETFRADAGDGIVYDILTVYINQFEEISKEEVEEEFLYCLKTNEFTPRMKYYLEEGYPGLVEELELLFEMETALYMYEHFREIHYLIIDKIEGRWKGPLQIRDFCFIVKDSDKEIIMTMISEELYKIGIYSSSFLVDGIPFYATASD